ncbi:hypothetical protein ACHAXT_001186 [Thalassiosira profunda]
MKLHSLLLALVAVINRSSAQDYDYADGYEYADGQDTMYEDYAMKHQNQGGKVGLDFPHMAIASAASYVLGAKIHSGRMAKKLKQKHKKDQKDVLEEQKAEQQMVIDQLQRSLSNTNEKHEMENLQREYEEFQQPDVDGDDRISRTEFNAYVKNYLSNYPGLTEKDYPKFEDFDHDKDGYVSFQEYAQQMAVQAQQAELDQYYAQSQGQSGNKEAQKANALYDLYGSSTGSDGFNDLYAQIRR